MVLLQLFNVIFDLLKTTANILKRRRPEKFAVITLKFEQDGFTEE